MGGWWKVLGIISGGVYIILGTHFMPLQCVHIWVVKTINIALCIFYHERIVEGVNFQGGFNNSFKSHNLRREDYYKSILQEKRLNIHTLSVLKRN